jgi:hypothetical protein
MAARPMSYWYSDTTRERPTSIARGRAPLEEIWSAAREQMRLVENGTAAGEALTRAYDERIKAIQDATGETFQNPMRVDLSTGAFEQKRNPTYSFETGNESREAKIQKAVDGFNTWLVDVSKRHPDKAGVILADQPVERDAEALAKQADERLGRALANREGLGKWVSLFGGGVSGSLYDPLQAMSLVAGGGPGAARTVGGRILAVTLKEAAINGIFEAAQQPQVQAWRKQVGLPNGFDEAAKNVAFATALGGVLGGSFQAAGEGIGRALRNIDTDTAARALADAPTVRPEFRSAIDGDARAAADLLAPIRADLPPEARGALAAVEMDRIVSDARPAAATPSLHDSASARAIAAAQANTAFFHDPAPEQISRIVDQLIPAEAAPARSAAEPESLERFLTRAGGVKDFKGELKAIGMANRSERFVGKLVREDGLPLDQARLKAAEAGYFNDLYGTVENAMEKSTVTDLLDRLDTASRETTTVRDAGDGRAYAESLVYDIAARAGPAVDDRLILQAAELANAEGLSPADALDRVLIADDAERFAAEAGGQAERWTPQDRSGGLDDPLAFPDEMAFSARDLADLEDDFDIPFFDDEGPVSAAAVLDDIKRLDHLKTVVEACRI